MFLQVKDLDLGRIHPYCLGERDDHWVTCRAGPLAVHLFTPEARDEVAAGATRVFSSST